MVALISGLLTGLSLIIAIGAQNAFVISQGLARSHVLLVVIFCSISDALLIFLGAGGLGALIKSVPSLIEYIRWFGVTYLLWFGSKTLISAFKNRSLAIGSTKVLSKRKVVATLFAFTFLNPHVYLDTVIFLGSIANQFGSDKWLFAIGATIASTFWFFALGYGARAASAYMTKPIFWRVLDFLIAAVMFSAALLLALYELN